MLVFDKFKNTFLSGLITSLLFIMPVWGQVLPGAQQLPEYLPLLVEKNIGLVAHAASRIYHSKGSAHLVDSLLSHEITIKTIFAPEHGFRSKKDNGELIVDEIDSLTQIPIISLHGKHRKPTVEQLENIDIVVFDLQDVGVRFYTYLSTLHLVMEACAEQGIPLMVLDRPNPNGHYVDGPVLEDDYKSFLGMHNVPIVHGMTLGEYATMINGEGWLASNLRTDLSIIKNTNYTHQTTYDLPVRPSPNLPNAQAVNLYPSLCLFEQTPISIGRGTEMQFQVFGHPLFTSDFDFTPRPNFGAKYPKLDGQLCKGTDLREHKKLHYFELKWIIKAYQAYPVKDSFFKERFAFLSGTKALEDQIKDGWSIEKIRASWEPQLKAFKELRANYLLYPTE